MQTPQRLSASYTPTMNNDELKAKLKAALDECWRLAEDDKLWTAANRVEEAVVLLEAMQMERVRSKRDDEA